MLGFVASNAFVIHDMNPDDKGLGARLRELPDFDPPAGGWVALERRRRRDASRRLGGFALAASMLVATVVGLGVRSGYRPGVAAGAGLAESTNVTTLAAQSQALQRDLRQVSQNTVWDAARAERSAALESQLALVDLQLEHADPRLAHEFWQDRVSLMNALVDAHDGTAGGGAAVEYLEY